MQIPNGHWGEYARTKGKTIWSTAQVIGASRRSLYKFLEGDASRLGKQKRAALAKLWRISLPGLLKKIEERRQERVEGRESRVESQKGANQ